MKIKDLKDLNDFKGNCNDKYCNRTTKYNAKTCKTEYKQNLCYKKYVLKKEARQD